MEYRATGRLTGSQRPILDNGSPARHGRCGGHRRLRHRPLYGTGWIYEPGQPDNKGFQFDSSAGRQPLAFVLGTTVITGFNQGIVGMAVGGTRRIVIPPDLGYGPAPNGPIPGNSTLIFEVSLVSIS